MTAKEILTSDNIYLRQENIEGIDCSIGYIKKFRWSWMATQLNVFVIIGETGSHITKKMIEDFSAACMKYALKNNKGWPRGLQSGVGSIAILKGPGADQEATHFCEHPSKKHWSAFEIPVIYDTSARRAIRYKSKPIWGAIYFSFFTKTIDGITGKL